MKRLALAAAILVIAAALLVTLTIQPAQLHLLNPQPDGSIAGVLHVHTNRSDGRAGIDEIAAAAGRAGLKFVVFTDHGDATAPLEPPAYRSGVLCIDAVEISTAGGHVLALDMPVSPYPLAGEPRDVVDDIHRLGGFAVAAHPDSPKPELRWRDWDVPVDGVETLNLDSSWRQWVDWAGDPLSSVPGPGPWRARGRLAAALIDYPFRPPETIAGLVPPLQAPHYAAMAAVRRVVSLAGADAHSKIGLRGDPQGGGPSLPIPGYEPTFRTMSVHVTTERPLTGDAAGDAKLLMAGIRAGHLYTVLDAIATPPSIEFSAQSETGTASGGDELPAGGAVTFRVRSNMPPDFAATIWNGTKAVKGGHDQEFTVEIPGDAGAYWLTITSVRPSTLGAIWIRTNPIYIRGPEATAAQPSPAAAPATNVEALFDSKTSSGWQVENDPNSQGAVDAAKLVDSIALRFRYGLGGGTPTGPFVAIVHDVPNGVTPADRVAFTVHSEQPLRISMQVRLPAGAGFPSERWQRSIYTDTTPRDYEVRMDELTPVGATHAPQPSFADVRSLLFVIDTINTKPGASGRVWFSNLRFER